MNIRESHESPLGFDLFLIGVAIFGAVVAWLCARAGGAWLALGAAALLGEMLLVYGSFIEPRRVVVLRYRERMVSKPKTWVRIVFLSDVHAGGFKPASWFTKVAHVTQSLKPDIAILGGDYVVDHSGPIHDLDVFASLTASIGKYYVMGNHDLVDMPQDIRAAVEAWGYECIEHRMLQLSKDDRRFDLLGMADPWFGNPSFIARTSRDIPHILISHEPDMLMDLVKGDTDVMISGHTHGGQVRLPLIGALYPIPARLGRLVDQGRKVVNGIPCIISNGLGESDGRLRLCAPPSILCIDVGI